MSRKAEFIKAARRAGVTQPTAQYNRSSKQWIISSTQPNRDGHYTDKTVGMYKSLSDARDRLAQDWQQFTDTLPEPELMNEETELLEIARRVGISQPDVQYNPSGKHWIVFSTQPGEDGTVIGTPVGVYTNVSKARDHLAQDWQQFTDTLLEPETAVIPADPDSQLATSAPTRRYDADAAQQALSNTAFGRFFAEKADNTVKAYDRDWRRFCEFLFDDICDCQMESAVTWQAIAAADLEMYKEFALREGYSRATINRTLSSLRSLSRVAHDAGFIDETTLEAIRRTRYVTAGRDDNREKQNMPTRKTTDPVNNVIVKKVEARVLTESEAARLLSNDSYDLAKPHDMRLRVITWLAWETCARANELCRLTWQPDPNSKKSAYVDLEAGTVRLYRSKVRKTHTFRLSDELVSILKDWRAFNMSDYVIPQLSSCHTIVHKPISRTALSHAVKLRGKLLGIEPLSSHDIRHSSITRAAQRGANVDELMALGGWSSMDRLKTYVDSSAPVAGVERPTVERDQA